MLAQSPQLQGLGQEDLLNSINVPMEAVQEAFMSKDVENRKLVILGLPWETTEETFQQYFQQFGTVEEATIMKERNTGKSRGFGFVVYYDPADAARVVEREHVVDGRRCEAKYAEPRGAGQRCSRIFVARIHPSVTDSEFREYFAQFGSVQDAYMPREASKLGHRGIGFVTFASPDAVEKLMASRHTLKGQELAVDRATPKEKGISTAVRNRELQDKLLHGAFAQNPLFAQYHLFAQLISQQQHQMDPQFGGHDHGIMGANAALGNALGGAGGNGPAFNTGGEAGLYHQQLPNGSELEGGQGVGNMEGLQQNSFLRLNAHRHSAPLEAFNSMLPGGDMTGLGLSQSAPGRSMLMQGHGPRGPTDASRGPRIFVGKLNKSTSGQDVKDYFTRFGYVLDVYMPRDKMNRNEHRGFGFVTFETEGAIARVAAHGTHQIRGSIVAIDTAVPRRSEPFPRSGSGTSGDGDWR
eukprot:jgi/Botrbrau1/20330/Bobra.0006s0011.2